MDQYLEVFVKVVDKKNFSRAAEELHMTQPAVSQYIRTLEVSVGTRLLERNNKFVRLTKAGEIVYQHAKEILSLYTRMQYLVDDLTNKASGPVAIGASYTFGEYILPHIIADLQKGYPLIQPSILIHNTSEIIEMVKKRELDIGIIEGLFNEPNLNVEVVSKDKMVIVASPHHPLVNKEEKIKLSDLSNETWILREKGSGTREAAENLFRVEAFNPINKMEFGSNQVIKESVEAGLGITLLSLWAIGKELTHEYMAVINTWGLPFNRNFSIITHSPYQTKALKTFIDVLHQYVRDQEKELPVINKHF